MKYLSRRYTEETAETISKEDARFYLTGNYKEGFVNAILDNNKAFRLYTPYREIWTVDDNGMTPMAGFCGVCE